MKKLTLRNYVGYTAGDMANNLAFSLQALFLLIYYTNVVGSIRRRSRRCSSSYGSGTPSPTSRPAVWSTSRGPAGASSGRTCCSRPFRSCSPASPCSPFPHSTAHREVRLRVRHLCAAGLPVLADEHSVRVAGHRNDPGSGRAVPPGDLALRGPDHRHLRPRHRDRSADHPATRPQPDQLQSFLTTVTIVFAVSATPSTCSASPAARSRSSTRQSPSRSRRPSPPSGQNRPLLILCVSNLVFLTGVFGLQAAQAYYAAYILGDSSLPDLDGAWRRRCPPSSPCRSFPGSSPGSARRRRSSSAPRVWS